MNDGCATTMTFGDEVTLARAVEWVGEVAPVARLFPSTPASVWVENERELAPALLNPPTGMWRAAMQTWVLLTPSATVLIDTGVGNDRHRPQAPLFSGLRTDFLDVLAEAGAPPSEVGVVVNTHIHYDHVGWNTTLADGQWVPTFPSARHVMPSADVAYFDPARAGEMRPPTTDDERLRFDGAHVVFRDSIAPILDAGLADLWDQDTEIVPGLRLEQTAGHTPGSSVVWLDAGDGAVFVGDLLHSPVQLLRPDDPSVFDLDAGAAARTRLEVLAQAEAETRWIFPAHLAGHGGFRIRRDGAGFAISEWAPFCSV